MRSTATQDLGAHPCLGSSPRRHPHRIREERSLSPQGVAEMAAIVGALRMSSRYLLAAPRCVYIASLPRKSLWGPRSIRLLSNEAASR